MSSVRRETSRFKVRGEDGRDHMIVEFTEFIDVTSLGDSSRQYIEGLKEYRTLRGEYVNRTDDKTFEILGVGTAVRFN